MTQNTGLAPRRGRTWRGAGEHASSASVLFCSCGAVGAATSDLASLAEVPRVAGRPRMPSTQRRLLGPLDIEVDPLVVWGQVREPVDRFLRDLEPVADLELLADVGPHLV